MRERGMSRSVILKILPGADLYVLLVDVSLGALSSS